MDKYKYLLVLLLSVMSSLMVQAHDFAVSQNGNTLCYQIVSSTEKTVVLTYMGGRASGKPSWVNGEIEIPATVTHEQVTYRVVGIGPKAFSGATTLTGITLPSGLTSIGDFAFEHCTSLSKVVFPGNAVKFGQGVFFGCTSLRAISLGSDWTSVDLAMFRWSDSLTTLSLPAKLEKVQNLKKLKALKSVDVDVSNTHFSSVQGVLYNQDGSVLYGVPRGYEGTLVVAAGTKTITNGALIDCPGITAIDLPASVETFSFRETSRLTNLKQVILRSETPLLNAYSGGKGYFTLQLAGSDVAIIVPQTAKKAWQNALATEAGSYALSNAAGSVPYTLTLDEMPTSKQVKGQKNL